MIDFKIKKGPSSYLFIDGEINPRLLIEEGCWYLTEDTAELYVGAYEDGKLTLKRINGAVNKPVQLPSVGEGTDPNAYKEVLGAYIDKDTNKFYIIFSDGSESVLDNILNENSDITLANFITKDELEAKKYVTKEDLTGYSKFSGSYNDLTDKPEIPEAEIYKVDFNAPDYAKAIEAYNNGKVLVLTNAAPDINSYAVMNYVSERYITFTKFLISRSEAYGAFNTYYLNSDNTWEVAKEVRLNKIEANTEGETAGELTTIKIGKEAYSIPRTNVDNFATKAELKEAINNIEHPSVNLEGYATEQFVTGEINKIEIPDVSDFITMQDVEDKNYLTEVPKGFATETFVHEMIAKAELDDKEADLEAYYTKEQVDALIPDVSGFALKTEIPSVEGLASEEYVTNAINSIEIPEVNFDGYATETWVEEKGYLTEHQSLEDYAKKSELFNKDYNELLNKPELFSGSYNDLTDKPSIPSIEGLATESYVDNKFDTIVIPDVSGFATKEELNEAIEAIEHPTADLTGYATEQFVNDAIANIDLPEVPETDLSNYFNKSEVITEIANAVAEKADTILFTTAKFVKNPIGDFKADEDISGLSIAELFAKLLGLSSEIGTPDEPNTPDEPKNLIERIIADKTPMYSITQDGVLAITPFKLVEGNENPSESGFYTVKDNEGSIIEAGYQDLSIKNDEMYYIIALPKEIDYNTMIDLVTWDPVDSKWVSSELALTSEPTEVANLCDEAGVDISHIDTNVYTVWANGDICTGSILRYTIKENN